MAFNFNQSSNIFESSRSLPVFLLLDTSGSMWGDKINNLNEAVKEMVNDFKQVDNSSVDIKICMISFSDSAQVAVPLSSVRDVSVPSFSANGGTDLGAALSLAKKMIEDRSIVTPRSYRPIVIVVTDGYPNSGWENNLQVFMSSGRSAKCDRMAMLIGERDDRAIGVMAQFLRNSGNQLFYAKDADSISKFFKFVSTTTTTRTMSQTPDVAVPMPKFAAENTIVIDSEVSTKSQTSPVSRVAETIVIDQEEEDE